MSNTAETLCTFLFSVLIRKLYHNLHKQCTHTLYCPIARVKFSCSYIVHSRIPSRLRASNSATAVNANSKMFTTVSLLRTFGSMRRYLLECGGAWRSNWWNKVIFQRSCWKGHTRKHSSSKTSHCSNSMADVNGVVACTSGGKMLQGGEP